MEVIALLTGVIFLIVFCAVYGYYSYAEDHCFYSSLEQMEELKEKEGKVLSTMREIRERETRNNKGG